MAEKTAKADEEYLGKGNLPKLIAKFSIPCVIALVVSALYNIVDQIFIGKKIGELGNAATNIVYPFTVIALGLALLIGDGAASLFSLSLGKKDYDSANKSFATALITSVGVSVVLTAAGYILMKPILTLFGVTDSTYSYAKDYLTIILIGFPFYIITNALNPVIRADGSPRYAMAATLVGAAINLVLDPIALFVLNWGMKGAALATIVGQIVSFIMEVVYFIKPKTLKLSKRNFRFDFGIFKKELRLGVTSFIAQFSQVIMITVINNLCKKFGDASEYGAVTTQAVTGIVMKVFGIVNSIALGLAAGSQPIVGYNYGSQNYGRVKTTYKYLIIVSVAVGAVATILFESCPQAIIKLFSSAEDLANPSYVKFAKLCFRIYLGSTMFTCLVRTSAVFLQALGKAMKSLLVSLTRDLFVSLPAVILLAYLGGIEVMLWAPFIADIISSVLVIVLITYEFKKFKSAPQAAAVTDTAAEIKEDFIMSDGNRFVVTVSREFGSGGRYVGKLLAQKLGINCYDKEIISLTAKKSGLSESYVEKYSEKKKSGNYLGNNDDRMFIAESEVIHTLAARESCVIVGRCADFILQDIKDKITLINIFVYNTDDGKVKRAVEYYGFDERDALSKINSINRQRAKHYKYYTGKKWAVISDYDFAINSDFVDIDRIAEIVKDIVTEKISLND